MQLFFFVSFQSNQTAFRARTKSIKHFVRIKRRTKLKFNQEQKYFLSLFFILLSELKLILFLLPRQRNCLLWWLLFVNVDFFSSFGIVYSNLFNMIFIYIKCLFTGFFFIVYTFTAQVFMGI